MADESKFRDQGSIDDHTGKEHEQHKPMEHRDDVEGYQGNQKDNYRKDMPDKSIDKGYQGNEKNRGMDRDKMPDLDRDSSDYGKDKGTDYNRK